MSAPDPDMPVKYDIPHPSPQAIQTLTNNQPTAFPRPLNGHDHRDDPLADLHRRSPRLFHPNQHHTSHHPRAATKPIPHTSPHNPPLLPRPRANSIHNLPAIRAAPAPAQGHTAPRRGLRGRQDPPGHSEHQIPHRSARLQPQDPAPKGPGKSPSRRQEESHAERRRCGVWTEAERLQHGSAEEGV